MSFLEALSTDGSGTISDITLRRNLLYVMWTTRGDVAGLLTWVLYFIVQHPRILNSIEVKPTPGRSTSWLAPSSSVDRIVAETLRLEQSEFLYRKAREDVRWKGFLIPKGWLVRVCTRDAHQRAPCFPNAERFDPDRFLHRKFGHGEYAPFGMGRHSCLGTHMVFAIARGFLYELKTSYEVQLIERGGRILGGRHWSHWKPDNSFSIRVDTRH